MTTGTPTPQGLRSQTEPAAPELRCPPAPTATTELRRIASPAQADELTTRPRLSRQSPNASWTHCPAGHQVISLGYVIRCRGPPGPTIGHWTIPAVFRSASPGRAHPATRPLPEHPPPGQSFRKSYPPNPGVHRTAHPPFEMPHRRVDLAARARDDHSRQSTLSASTNRTEPTGSRPQRVQQVERPSSPRPIRDDAPGS